MAFPLQLCSNNLTTFVACVSSSSSSSSSSSIPPVSLKRTYLGSKSCFKVLVHCSSVTKKTRASNVEALLSSSNPNGGDQDARYESDEDEDYLIPNLPLDAKLQSKLEKKMKMKVTKNIRLRRKKLVHKRRLRKNGGFFTNV